MLAHAMLPSAVVRCEPGPNYRDEVCAPGRQGIRAKRDFNPARGSATSFGPSHHGLAKPPGVPFLGLVPARSGVNCY